MKIIISPAKTMVEGEGEYASLPQCISHADQIRQYVCSLQIPQLMQMWGCSEKIAEANYKRFADMDLHAHLMCAIERYTGMQYQNLDYSSLSDAHQEYIKDHVFIVDAFYGLLKPDDGIVTYRMDFHADLQIEDAVNLYAYWKDVPASLIQDDVLINLASDEYAKAILPYYKGKVINIRFARYKNGKLVSASTLAKKARGRFLRWMAQEGIENTEHLKLFACDGFVFEPAASSDTVFIFVG